MANDPIVAVATPAGRGGVAIVRLSGPALKPLLRALIAREVQPRLATRAKFLDAKGAVIDHGLALFFPAPHSYSGEDVIELHGHGGPAVVQLLLTRCLELGVRIAEPGEFTKRAFLNDKLDLAQAEGVADLINATTAEAARCAVRSLEGEFSAAIDDLVRQLTDLRMLIEATLDFPDEEIDGLESSAIGVRLARLRGAVAAVANASRQGSLLREGIHVVLAGMPNVGKSSLLNMLAGAERAIVTDIPGTTRDTVRETVDIRGIPLHFVDTAGLREAADPIEKIGIARSHDAISKADVVIWVADAMRPETMPMGPALTDRISVGVNRILAINKSDLLGAESLGGEAIPVSAVKVSAKTGDGIESLKDALLSVVGWGNGEGAFLARSRHLIALKSGAEHIDAAVDAIRQLELCAEELRLAQSALASITGEVTADDLLGKIFSQFCIGK